MRRFALVLTTTAALLGCPAPPPAPDAGPEDDAGEPAPDAGPDLLEEVEPNDGTTPDEVNALEVGAELRGVIDADDADIFAVATTAGQPYRVHLTLPAGSALEGHLTVLDDGRDGDAAGSDYLQISRDGLEADVNLELMAMGGGHLIIVRDGRNVGGSGFGGADHRYTLVVEELALDEVAQDVSPPEVVSDSLAHAGAMKLYRFSATSGQDALFSFSTNGDMDGRFFVMATETGSWIARNDDGPSAPDPLIDAPLFADGEMFLVVDNITEDAADLGYTVDLALP
jgi:hypothetical protein